MPFSSLFGSPKFRDFTLKCFYGAESLRSPSSILETSRALCPSGNPFSCETTIVSPTQKPNLWNTIDSIGIGLVLVQDDEVVDVNSDNQTNGKVLFGKQLRLKIPPLLPPSNFSPFQTCDSDFGTRPKDTPNSGICTNDSLHADAVVGSLSEMELSEEYTCIISHGPNPRTTHIFDNCILESYFCSLPNKPHSTLVNFLSFCFTCNKHLEQTKDIFIYRGEKAFCSRECRLQEIALDDGSEN